MYIKFSAMLGNAERLVVMKVMIKRKFNGKKKVRMIISGPQKPGKGNFIISSTYEK